MPVRRPAWIIFVGQPGDEVGAAKLKSAVLSRCSVLGEADAGGVRFDWSSELRDRMVVEGLQRGLAAVAAKRGARLAPSILLVWDGQAESETFLRDRFQETRRMLDLFREALQVLTQGATSAAADVRFEILLRVPMIPRFIGNAEGQKAWTKDLESVLNPEGRQRAGVTRVWILGSSNQDQADHRDGIMVSDSEEYDALLLETLGLWASLDLNALVEREGAGGSPRDNPFASLGFGRLRFDGRTLQARRARTFALSLLEEALANVSDVASVSPETYLEENNFIKGVAGLTARALLPAVLHRDKDTIRSMRASVSLALEDDGVHGPLDDPRLCEDVPSRIMTVGNLKVARGLFLAANQIADFRDQLLLATAADLDSRIAEELAERRPYLLQTEHLLKRWRSWAEEQQQKVEEVVAEHFRIDGDEPAPSWIARLFGYRGAARELVAEDDPDPQAYCDKLTELLAHRPSEGAWVARSLLGSLVLGQVAGVFAGDVSPLLVNVPVLSSPWVITALVPAVWLSFTAFRVHRRRVRRDCAVQALRIAIVRRGQVLLQGMLTRQLHAFYGDLADFVGLPEHAEARDFVQDHLEQRLQKMREKESYQGLLGRSLFRRLGEVRRILREVVQHERSADCSPASGNAWVRTIPEAADLEVFPFLGGIPKQIREEDGRKVAEVFPEAARECHLVRNVWSRTVFAAGTVSDDGLVLEPVSAWCAERGFGYIAGSPMGRLLSVLVKRRPELRKDWADFLRRTSYPYFPLKSPAGGTNVRFHVAWPKAEPGEQAGLLEELIADWELAADDDWQGEQGVLVGELAGPVGADALGLLHFAYDPPETSTTGPDREEQAEV